MDTQKKGGIGGLLVLFLIYALVGSLLSFVYIFLVDVMPSIYVCGILAVAFGAIMGLLVRLLRRVLHVSNIFLSLLAILLGIAVMSYVKWNLFFSLHDSRYYFWDYGEEFSLFADFGFLMRVFADCLATPGDFISGIVWYNDVGTWSYGENPVDNVRGGILAVIWVGEFIILSYSSLREAFRRVLPKAPLPSSVWQPPVEGFVVSETTTNAPVPGTANALDPSIFGAAAPAEAIAPVADIDTASQNAPVFQAAPEAAEPVIPVFQAEPAPATQEAPVTDTSYYDPASGTIVYANENAGDAANTSAPEAPPSDEQPAE